MYTRRHSHPTHSLTHVDSRMQLYHHISGRHVRQRAAWWRWFRSHVDPMHGRTAPEHERSHCGSESSFRRAYVIVVATTTVVVLRLARVYVHARPPALRLLVNLSPRALATHSWRRGAGANRAARRGVHAGVVALADRRRARRAYARALPVWALWAGPWAADCASITTAPLEPAAWLFERTPSKRCVHRRSGGGPRWATR